MKAINSYCKINEQTFSNMTNLKVHQHNTQDTQKGKSKRSVFRPNPAMASIPELLAFPCGYFAIGRFFNNSQYLDIQKKKKIGR